MEYDWTGKRSVKQLKIRAFTVALAAVICGAALYMLW